MDLCAKTLAILGLAAGFALATGGCAAETDEDPENAGETEDALSTVAMGVDTNGSTLDLGYAKGHGYGFVGRYLSFDGSHPPLTASEVARFRGAAMPLIAIWEVGQQRSVETGSIAGQFQAGAKDAQKANAQLAQVGAAGKPVYFTVDFNVTSDYWNGNTKDTATKKVITRGELILSYFKGINSVIGAHRTGAYGSYATIKGLFDAGRIGYGWQQTFGTKGAHIDPRAQLRQYDIYPDQTGWGVGGAGALDLDRAVKHDFGQF